MTIKEARTAQLILWDRVERDEIIPTELGTYCYSVEWYGGGSRVFWSMNAVREYLSDRCRAEGGAA